MYSEAKLATVQYKKLQTLHCRVQESVLRLIFWIAWITFPIGKAQCESEECNTGETIHASFFKQKLVSIVQEMETADVGNFNVTLRHNSTFSAFRVYSVLS